MSVSLLNTPTDPALGELARGLLVDLGGEARVLEERAEADHVEGFAVL